MNYNKGLMIQHFEQGSGLSLSFTAKVSITMALFIFTMWIILGLYRNINTKEEVRGNSFLNLILLLITFGVWVSFISFFIKN